MLPGIFLTPAGTQLVTGTVGYSSNVRVLRSPPRAVGNEDLTDKDHVHVFLEKVLTLNQDLIPDTGEVIPAGSRIRSYFFHYDPPGHDRGGNSGNGFVRFDHPILGVINETATLDATDALLGSPRTDYSGTVIRRWSPPDGDSFEFSGERFDFSAHAFGGQDQLRVIVGPRQEPEVLLTGCWSYLGGGRATVQQTGPDVHMQLTYTPNPLPGPHYEVEGTLSARALSGVWRYLLTAESKSRQRHGAFQATVSRDGKTIRIWNTEDTGTPSHHWNNVVMLRLPCDEPEIDPGGPSRQERGSYADFIEEVRSLWPLKVRQWFQRWEQAQAVR